MSLPAWVYIILIYSHAVLQQVNAAALSKASLEYNCFLLLLKYSGQGVSDFNGATHLYNLPREAECQHTFNA